MNTINLMFNILKYIKQLTIETHFTLQFNKSVLNRYQLFNTSTSITSIP